MSEESAIEHLGNAKLLYEQGPCFVLSKPGGLLTQAPPEIDSMERRIKAWIKARESKTGNVYLGVPHRLDRPASGALVFARHARAARRLAAQFEGRLVRKVYWTIVECADAAFPEEGTWTDSMRKVPNEARAEITGENEKGAQLAVLKYRTLASSDRLRLLEIELETGRTHQIRLQAGSRGVPILGDALYGSTSTFGPQSDDPRGRWIALHARQLGFEHPMNREQIEVTAPLPTCWDDLAELGLPDLAKS